eukprot:TRINITY_DN5478_c0_g1_i1.p1 TRINITY_DN5478_c0_g1~~TRINITY_DN5478_c0_g1_i1.p1  ORF type:complete len:319 (+),score=94.72 TRINITY_DN5478_c0_g1_i1:102-959(+)
MDTIAKAEKTLKKWSLFSNKEAKNEEAAELYQRAAQLYKLAKKWPEAAQAYISAAECQIRIGGDYDVASSFADAAVCYKKTGSNTTDAVQCLQQSVDVFTTMGKFIMAAKNQKEIAELLENDMETRTALEAYEKAADLYNCEDNSSTANQCLLKVALLSAQVDTDEDYKKAYEIFERVAAAALNNNLLKYSAKDYFLKAGICRLCTKDYVCARNGLESYQNMDPSFVGSREAKLLEALCDAADNMDVESFTNAVYDFDAISKLDTWKTTMLLRIKNGLREDEDVL